MIRIVYAPRFLKSAKRKPNNIQRTLANHLSLLQKNPFHPRLHTKRLSGSLAGFLSFRVSRDWRVVFQFLDAQTVKLLRAADRKDIYRKRS